MSKRNTVAENDPIIGYHKVVIVGCGHSGVINAEKLRQARIDDFIILERADRVGGTWRENTYPGCACDVPSVFYSYSFYRNPEWSHVFPGQQEILNYIENGVTALGLRAHIHFNTEMIEAQWLEPEEQWRIVTNQGEYRCKYLVFATGPLTQEIIPDIPGIDDFAGDVFHSASWDHNCDLSGKRVAVIGTGASTAQFVPEIRKVAKEVAVFQRTAAWVLPRPADRDITGIEKFINQRTPLLQNFSREKIRNSLRIINYALLHPWAMKLIERIARRAVRKAVPEKELRDKIMPDFTLGCKRIIFSNEYYPALRADNTRLIASALSEIQGNRVIAVNKESIEADVIIFGTGFQVTPPPVAEKIRCSTGELLSERWAREGPEAYLGTTIHDLPNAFIMVGPNILIYSSFIEIAEWQANYIVDGITQMEKNDLAWFNLPREESRQYNQRVQRDLQGTVWNNGGCHSYYLDQNGKNFAAWPWGVAKLARALKHFDRITYQVSRGRAKSMDTPKQAERAERAEATA